eukprot:PhM_4_TR4736/c0_g1_i1/m.75931/K02937/RP-L7e, RPL7; large subunit ribosomal protein L7e
MGRKIPKHIGAGEGERVRVTVLKRRKSIEEFRNQKIRNALRTHQVSKQGYSAKPRVGGTKTQRLRPAKEYLVNTLRREHLARQVNMREKHVEEKELPTPTDGTAILVIRTRGNYNVSKKAKAIMGKYRLNRMHEAVFLAGSEEVSRDMHIVADYVVAGVPTQDQVRELVKHMSRYRDDKGVIQYLSGNLCVEKMLGQFGIVCVEDILEVIKQGGSCPVFNDVVKFLLPFNLAPPTHPTERDTLRSLYQKKEHLSQNSIAAFLHDALAPHVAPASDSAAQE